MILYESQLFALALNGETYSVAWMLGKLNSFYSPLDVARTNIHYCSHYYTLSKKVLTQGIHLEKSS